MKNSMFLLFLMFFYTNSLMAIGYREKYRGVLTHYQVEDRDSLKVQSCSFLDR